MRLRGALAASWLLLCAAAHAAPATLLLEELTSPELREAVAAGATTILVPIGGTEQNGPHIALGKHNARALALATRIAHDLGNALVAPVIAYVPEGDIEPPTAHMKFAGTVSIPVDAFERTLEGAARSFRRAGFHDIVFLGDHGGYRASLDRVSRKLDREWAASPVRVHALPEYYQPLPHAGRDDTSIALATGDGHLVRAPLAGAAAMQHGAAEDPTGASRERGIALSQQIVDRSVAAIKKATARR
jgi:creatinine amidohydrolase/Fe(II)-dependent formamide hydrolase-like protein